MSAPVDALEVEKDRTCLNKELHAFTTTRPGTRLHTENVNFTNLSGLRNRVLANVNHRGLFKMDGTGGRVQHGFTADTAAPSVQGDLGQ